MRLATGLLALALSIPSLAFAAGQQPKSVVAPTAKTWKTLIKGDIENYKAVPARTLNSAKFAKFMSNPANYVRVGMTPKLPPGMNIEGGRNAFVGSKIYPNKIFVGTSFIGKTTWIWGAKPQVKF